MNIYVGNLSFDASEDDVRNAFTQHGEVSSVKIISDQYTGKTRGFGFVEMPNQDEAQAAIAGLNGTDLQGRALNVNEARPRNDNRGGGGGGGGRGGHRGGGGGGGNRW